MTSMTSGDLTFGAPTVVNASGVTGNVSCSIASGTLTCTANGTPVQIQPSGGFDVTLSVTPTAAGIFSNPRLQRICRVDPVNAVARVG